MPSHVHKPRGNSVAANIFIAAGAFLGLNTNHFRFRADSNLSLGDTTATGGGLGHTHTLPLDLKYANFILAVKD